MIAKVCPLPRHARVGRTVLVIAGLLYPQTIWSDEIWIAPDRRPGKSDWFDDPAIPVNGDVERFDATTLIIGGQRFASWRVVDWTVEADSDDEAELIAAIRDGRQSDVMAKLAGVLKTRPPVWRQQHYVIEAIRSAFAVNQPSIGYKLLENLDRRPMAAIVVARLPIDWTGKRSGVRATPNGFGNTDAATAEPIQSDSPAVRLIAASRLMTGARRDEAARVLSELAKTHDRPVIAGYAKIIYATGFPPERFKATLPAAIELIERLPPVAQYGPVEMLRRRCRAYAMADMERFLGLLLPDVTTK